MTGKVGFDPWKANAPPDEILRALKSNILVPHVKFSELLRRARYSAGETPSAPCIFAGVVLSGIPLAQVCRAPIRFTRCYLFFSLKLPRPRPLRRIGSGRIAPVSLYFRHHVLRHDPPADEAAEGTGAFGFRAQDRRSTSITASGIHGLISNVKDDTVIVKVADNVKIEMEKSAITNVAESGTPNE